MSAATDNHEGTISHLEKAIRCLHEIVVHWCDGVEDLEPEYRDKARAAYFRLIEAKDELEWR